MSRPVATHANADPHKHKGRRTKLKRINGVKRDLSDLRRVFVFEQEAHEDKIESRMPEGAANTEAPKPRQASQVDRALGLSEEHDDDKFLAEDIVLDIEPFTPEAFNSRGQTRLRSFGEAAPPVKADEQLDMQSMASCFTSFTSASSFQGEYENGRRYHGYCAGLYL
jgi:hypothetical protein